MKLIKLIALAVGAEAIVELLFKAAPLQGARQAIIEATPFLRSEDQGHLLECKYCTSLWIAAGLAILTREEKETLLTLAGEAIIAHRLSNYLHTAYCTTRDHQINIRLKRQ